MPDYTIETTYHLPVFRHRTWSADTPEAACRAAIEDADWEHARHDHESAGETYVTGLWQGRDTAYGNLPLPVPSHFEETMQRQAAHFETLLGVLKIMVGDARAERRTDAGWISRASCAIAKAEAILAGARDPDQPVHPSRPSHVLATLQEDRVRDRIAALRDSGDAVTDEDIHTACVAVASASDLSEQVDAAEFRAVLAALDAADRRREGSR